MHNVSNLKCFPNSGLASFNNGSPELHILPSGHQVINNEENILNLEFWNVAGRTLVFLCVTFLPPLVEIPSFFEA